ncbi:MAG: CRISPR-associated endonuclease Cas2 [Candidatus Heimdallarchaeum endolithica]|uniref:CRISPR-associated endoribonuclease Cas2 n=1 Tax=Candidatus Heimdallarchaeum endolithica TaxID=2876572 RepID=A0A9Y1BP60_9ARCH|nr:MAG: CRISPR-associated endonuclease Cas2 [Candidatus Heimdallarchaeum endolithica]
MYAIIVYDVGVERVSKVCNFLRCFLERVQNSVFEGEITKTQLVEIENGLKRLMNEEHDCVRIYTIRSKELVKLSNLGIEKVETGQFI